MIDINKVKQDWAQHCKEYGFVSKITHRTPMSIILTCEEQDEDKFLDESEILYSGVYNRIVKMTIKPMWSGDKFYKLFTSFYEKLM